MQYEIRAMSLGEILDTAFRILRDHARLLIPIGMILAVPLSACTYALELVATPGDLQPEPAAIAIVGVLFLLVIATAWPFTMAAMTHSIGEVFLGRSVTVGQAARLSASIFLPLVGTNLLAGIVVGAISLVFGSIAFAPFTLNPLAGIPFLLPLPYLYLLFALLSQVIVLERAYGMRGLRRASSLIRGNMLRTFAILVVAGLIQGVLGMGVSLMLSFSAVAEAIGNAVVQALGMGFSAGSLVLLYFDIRCRNEAYDLDHLAQEVERAGPSPVPAA